MIGLQEQGSSLALIAMDRMGDTRFFSRVDLRLRIDLDGGVNRTRDQEQ